MFIFEVITLAARRAALPARTVGTQPNKTTTRIFIGNAPLYRSRVLVLVLVLAFQLCVLLFPDTLGNTSTEYYVTTTDTPSHLYFELYDNSDVNYTNNIRRMKCWEQIA